MSGDDQIPGTPTAAPPPHSEALGEGPATPEAGSAGGESADAEAGEGTAPAEQNASQAGDASQPLHRSGEQPRRRRRRRRRRPGPRPEGAAGEAAPAEEVGAEGVPAEASGTAGGEALAAAEGDRPATHPPRRVRVEAIAAGGEFTLADMPASEHPRRRRRRRRGARPEGAAAGGDVGAAAAGEGQEQQQQQRRERGPRRRGPRDRRDGDRPRRDGSPRPEGAPREERAAGQGRDGERRERDRDRGPPRHGKGGKPFGKGGKGGDRDRGRDGRRDKPAPKLYSFESVVDRGFEDVAPAAAAEGEAPAESGSRRIDWTIVKRTVADQRAAKTVSALYILKRDGGETEFPNLGAARAAVNKTIVHPEKLTRPKTDYPSTKK